MLDNFLFVMNARTGGGFRDGRAACSAKAVRAKVAKANEVN